MQAEIEITALGQAGFRLETPAGRILIDPWTAPDDVRLRTPPSSEELATRVAWVLITHEHADHLDLAFLTRVAERSPHATLVLPRRSLPTVADVLARERCHGVLPGDVLDLGGGTTAAAIPAFHALEPGDPTTDEGFLGYIVDADGLTLYHAGDTVVTERLIATLDRRRIDVALLPINGRDAFRERAGIVGNMTAREAVRFAAEIGAKTLIPIHWDMVAGNTERAGAALDAAAELDAPIHVLTLAHLRPFRLA